MGDSIKLLSWGVVLGVGLALGSGAVLFGGLTFIKFLAFMEQVIWGKKHGKKKVTVRRSKDWTHGDPGGILPPEK